MAAFREPLQAALAGPQDADRPRTYAAAEVLAGLLASGALFVAGAGAYLSLMARGLDAIDGRIAAYLGNLSLNVWRPVQPCCKNHVQVQGVWLDSGLLCSRVPSHTAACRPMCTA